jgi:hypothetical protein
VLVLKILPQLARLLHAPETTLNLQRARAREKNMNATSLRQSSDNDGRLVRRFAAVIGTVLQEKL